MSIQKQRDFLLSEIKINNPSISGIIDRIIKDYPMDIKFQNQMKQFTNLQQVEDLLYRISGDEADGEDRSWAKHVIQVNR